MKEFIFKHPFISLLLGSSMIDGVVKVTRTVAYAITGREGLAPNQLHIKVGGNEKKEEENDEPAGDIQ